ncbi:MAG: nucleotidyltransferase domain-containing protein [Pseudomonadota bacterium]
MKIDLKKILSAYGQNHPEISLIYLFGSHACSRAMIDSDIDVAILFKNSSYNDDILKYIIDLSKALKTDKLDLVILNKSTPLLSFQVIRHGKCLYNISNASRVRFETQTLREYLDLTHIFEIQRNYVKKQINKGEYFG